MVDYTKITVSKDGKYLFATEQGHLTYPLEAKVIYKLLKEKFPESEGYKVDVMMWESRGYEPDWVKEVQNMKTIIDKSECKPLSDNIEGKLVVIKPDFFKPEFREAKYQLVLATGGFGCDADKFGTAVFVTECCEDPEEYRQERYNLIGENLQKK